MSITPTDLISNDLAWTGERYIPSIEGDVELEHLHRYHLVRPIAAGKRVLDIACGEGYGSAHLADVAAMVVGVDIAHECIEHAARLYQRPNLRFQQGSCDQIPLPDHSVDLIVSFETIEHHALHTEMMQEFKRVLAPGGVVVISSPDKRHYSEGVGQVNPFHVKELYRNEFEALLTTYFERFSLYGQRIRYGSVIAPLDGEPAKFLDLGRDGARLRQSDGLEAPFYLIAVASDAGIPRLETGLFHAEPPEYFAIPERLNQKLSESDAKLRAAGHAMQGLTSQLETLTAEKDRLTRHLKAARRTINALHASASWRITRPLRFAKRVAAGSRRRLASLAENLGLRHRPAPAPELTAGAIDPTNAVGAAPPAAGPIVLPTASEPLVSVIVPIFGKIDYTLRCLRSIANNPPLVPFEVIIVDDHSPDDSVAQLQSVAGIRLVQSDTNQGFIRTCNLGATAAKGTYLCFLNNDTEVQPHWLDELVRTFELFPRTGLVGSKLIYPNGKLQEAGGIIWRDGSAWNFGNGRDPDYPLFNYAREVDYCSGASVLIPSELFSALGGFDEHYLPAYGEDSDLAFRVRERGLKVIYQPLSVVTHHEGITSGTDVTTGVKSYQLDNARKLFERWRDTLATHYPPGLDADRAKDRYARHRALVLDHCTPTPDQDAGSLTALNMMLLLRQLGFQVTFIPEQNFLSVPGYTQDLQRAGIEALYAPHISSVEQHLQEFGRRYDLVLIFRPTAAERHVLSIKRHCPQSKVLFHTADIHYLRMEREAALHGDAETLRAAESMRAIELATMRIVDGIIVHSTVERELVETAVPGTPVFVFPWAIPIRGTSSPFAARADVAFVGGYQHLPNVDAARYFIEQIFPLLQARLPGVRFLAIGSRPPPELSELASDHVVVTGFVEDLSTLLDSVRVAVAPLRYGAGIKGKIATALSVGLPSVATTIAVEGMKLTDGENVLVADDPAEFAARIAALYTDESLWQAISERGTAFARETYGPEAALGAMSTILEGIGFARTRLEGPVILIEPVAARAAFPPPSTIL